MGTYRKAAAVLARATTRQAHLAMDLLDTVPEHLDRPAVAQAASEGVVLGAYRYTASSPTPEPHHVESLTVVGKGGKRGAVLVGGKAVAEAVCPGRPGYLPGGSLTRPRSLPGPRSWRPSATDIEVLDLDAIIDEKLGGLLGVNRGLTEEPFVKLARDLRPAPSWGTVALVGRASRSTPALFLKPLRT